jgi:hypothetical protein
VHLVDFCSILLGTAHLITEEAENIQLLMFHVYTRFPVSVVWMQDTALGSKENTVKGSGVFQYSTEEENRILGLILNFVTGGLHFDDFLLRMFGLGLAGEGGIFVS